MRLLYNAKNNVSRFLQMTALTLTAASSVNAALEYLVEFSTGCVRRLAHESEYYNNGLNIYIYFGAHVDTHYLFDYGVMAADDGGGGGGVALLCGYFVPECILCKYEFTTTTTMRQCPG